MEFMLDTLNLEEIKMVGSPPFGGSDFQSDHRKKRRKNRFL